MANITVLALDPQTGDLCFDANGMLMLREDAEAIAQNVRNNLLTWKGEFPLNTDHGTDWERVVQQPRSEAVDEADSVVRSSIFHCRSPGPAQNPRWIPLHRVSAAHFFRVAMS